MHKSKRVGWGKGLTSCYSPNDVLFGKESSVLSWTVVKERDTSTPSSQKCHECHALLEMCGSVIQQDLLGRHE